MWCLKEEQQILPINGAPELVLLLSSKLLVWSLLLLGLRMGGWIDIIRFYYPSFIWRNILISFWFPHKRVLHKLSAINDECVLVHLIWTLFSVLIFSGVKSMRESILHWHVYCYSKGCLFLLGIVIIVRKRCFMLMNFRWAVLLAWMFTEFHKTDWWLILAQLSAGFHTVVPHSLSVFSLSPFFFFVVVELNLFYCIVTSLCVHTCLSATFYPITTLDKDW